MSRHEGRWRELFAERWEATKLAGAQAVGGVGTGVDRGAGKKEGQVLIAGSARARGAARPLGRNARRSCAAAAQLRSGAPWVSFSVEAPAPSDPPPLRHPLLF